MLDINKYYELNVWVNGDPQTCSALCLGSQTFKIQNKNTFVGLMQIVRALGMVRLDASVPSNEHYRNSCFFSRF